jgi:predicted kinase
LILLCGLPGSGKTTLAKQLATSIPAVRLCPDEWMAALAIDLYDEQFRLRLEAAFRQHALELLRLGQSTILEFGFWSRAERDELRLTARAVGAAVELHYLTAPLDELVSRLEARNALGGVQVPGDLLREWAQIFEAPNAAELAQFDNPPAPSLGPPNATSGAP